MYGGGPEVPLSHAKLIFSLLKVDAQTDSNAEDMIADINDLMEKCQSIQERAPALGVESEGEDEVISSNPGTAEEAIASVEVLMAKCSVIQQTAEEMKDGSYWKGITMTKPEEEDLTDDDQ